MKTTTTTATFQGFITCPIKTIICQSKSRRARISSHAKRGYLGFPRVRAAGRSGLLKDIREDGRAEVQKFPERAGRMYGCTDEELVRFERIIMERRGRAAAPATVAPIEDAPARPISMGMLMPSTIPALRGREKMGIFLKRFRTWACLNRCDSALDSEVTVNTSETPRAELKRLHEYSLVENSLKA